MAALLVWSSAHKKLAYDEFDNLAYGHRFLAQGPSAEMQGQRMPVLALNALPCRAEGCRQKVLNADESARLWVRLPTIAFTLALGVLVWRFAGELFGPRAALLALVLYAFQPTFLGHGKQVTSDVQTAFFAALAVYCFRRALRGPSHGWAAVAGLAVAGALASKFTSVLLVPILAAMALPRRDGIAGRDAARARCRRARGRPRRAQRRLRASTAPSAPRARTNGAAKVSVARCRRGFPCPSRARSPSASTTRGSSRRTRTSAAATTTSSAS